MLPSGNDAAFCIAESIGEKLIRNEWKCSNKKKKNQRGPLIRKNNKNADAFVEQMNREAGNLKMKDTIYSNPHGLPDEANYSTAQDQLILIKKCL